MIGTWWPKSARWTRKESFLPMDSILGLHTDSVLLPLPLLIMKDMIMEYKAAVKGLGVPARRMNKVAFSIDCLLA